MDGSRFDAIARALSSRRSTLRRLGALGGAGLFAGLGQGEASASHGACLHPGKTCNPNRADRCCFAEDEDVSLHESDPLLTDRHPLQEAGLQGERGLRQGQHDRALLAAERGGGLRGRRVHRQDVRRGLRQLRRKGRERLRNRHQHQRSALRRLQQPVRNQRNLRRRRVHRGHDVPGVLRRQGLHRVHRRPLQVPNREAGAVRVQQHALLGRPKHRRDAVRPQLRRLRGELRARLPLLRGTMRERVRAEHHRELPAGPLRPELRAVPPRPGVLQPGPRHGQPMRPPRPPLGLLPDGVVASRAPWSGRGSVPRSRGQ